MSNLSGGAKAALAVSLLGLVVDAVLGYYIITGGSDEREYREEQLAVEGTQNAILLRVPNVQVIEAGLTSIEFTKFRQWTGTIISARFGLQIEHIGEAEQDFLQGISPGGTPPQLRVLTEETETVELTDVIGAGSIQVVGFGLEGASLSQDRIELTRLEPKALDVVIRLCRENPGSQSATVAGEVSSLSINSASQLGDHLSMAYEHLTVPVQLEFSVAPDLSVAIVLDLGGASDLSETISVEQFEEVCG